MKKKNKKTLFCVNNKIYIYRQTQLSMCETLSKKKKKKNSYHAYISKQPYWKQYVAKKQFNLIFNWAP